MFWGTIIRPSKKGLKANLNLQYGEKAICLGKIGKTGLSIMVLRKGYKTPQKYHVDFWESRGESVKI